MWASAEARAAAQLPRRAQSRGCMASSASFAGVLNRPKVQWFIGAGGPVPITPGYVPYIVSTRSPRDFFSFAPMNPDAR